MTLFQRRTFKIFVALLLIAGFLYAPFYQVPEAQAGTISSLGKCLKSSAIFALIKGAIAFLIAAIWVVPTLEGASLMDLIKEYFEDPFARCMARELHDSNVAALLKVVRTMGRDGGAGFIRNWRNFFTNAEYRAENLFRGILANTVMCDWVRNGIYSQFGVSAAHTISLAGINLRIGSLNPFAVEGRCPFPNGFDLAAFEADPMANGGWDAYQRFFADAANPMGMTRLAQAELAKNKKLEEKADTAEAETGRGFMAQRGQVQTPNNPGESTCRVMGPNGKCIIYTEIRTPATYVEGAANATQKSELDWVVNVDELAEIVSTWIAQRLTNRILDLGGPEADTTFSDNPMPSYTVPPYPSTTPFPGTTNPPVVGVGCSAPAVPVVAAIDWVVASNPSLFDVDGRIIDAAGNYPGDTDWYMDAVVARLNSQGYRAQVDPNAGERDIIDVNNGTIGTEEWDILAGGRDNGWVRRFYLTTICPPYF